MRLDAALVARGLARSRGHARDLIGHGVVRVGDEVAVKGSRPVQDDDVVVVDAGSEALDPSWVSRAAGKLIGALEDLPGGGPRITGARAADVGACTGGFTQVLLRRGASSVVAIDVGHDQLAQALKNDPRVVDLSGRNIRDLTASDIGGVVDLLVADVSFISLSLIMGRLSALVRPGGDLMLLIKPQFEVGREGLDGRGVVRPGHWRDAALRSVLTEAVGEGLVLRGLVVSRTLGQDGNTEYVAWLSRPAAPDVAPSWQAVCDTVDHVVPLETTGGQRP
jgi:23S rRNA (cytidine1920-2'-O)/16S rRNA (cytidine1409-2'-O)-methyltransferase